MDMSVLDLEKQVPDIIRALKRRKKVIVSYGDKKLALLQPLPDDDVRDNPAFGMWRDRTDLANPDAVVRAIRQGRKHAL